VTDERKAALEAYLRYLGDRLGLGGWVWQVFDECPDGHEKSDATSHLRWNSPMSTVWFSPEVLAVPADLRQTALHEVLHAHTEHAWATSEESCRPFMPAGAWDVFAKAYRRHVELSMERLSFALAPLFDLPDLPE
jgi:hypothetical protein